MKVYILREVSEQGVGEVGSPLELRPNIDLPEGFKAEGGYRKFIVLRDREDQPVVIIGPPGPPMGKSYYHKAILAVMRQQFGLNDIRGGGMVTFHISHDSLWAHFDGASGDFGVFDPMILTQENHATLIEQIGMQVRFTWES